MNRNDDFLTRRAHLEGLDDQALRERFWSLADRLTAPLLQMGREYTTPSIERSVLLRMGFSSLEAAALVKGCLEHGLLGHGAGHLVYKLGLKRSLPPREAGLELLSGGDWEGAKALFEGGEPA
ncbi:MAG: ornithine aminomutase [Clostridiales bacterium]|nr:ornithine aminomutase [Clostridiales bacterium]